MLSSDLPTLQVCVADNTYGNSCRYKTYSVQRGDTCSDLLAKKFSSKSGTSPAALYIDLNKSPCDKSLTVGKPVCLPYGVKP